MASVLDLEKETNILFKKTSVSSKVFSSTSTPNGIAGNFKLYQIKKY